jgi:hypothetical protein
MADSDKNIIITPNRGLSGQPEIYFGGSGGVPIRMKVLDDSFGTLSWEGSAGQLFSINNNLTSGSIFSVNDVSGIPSIDVNADGTVTLAPYGGNVGIGVTAPNTLLHVGGTASASGFSASTVVATNGFQVGAGSFNAQTAGYTLAASDNGKIITINSASAVTITVGTAVGTAGFSCTIIQLGAGQVTIAASGTTLNSASGLKLAAQHAAASIVCYTTNTFNVAGNLTT